MNQRKSACSCFPTVDDRNNICHLVVKIKLLYLYALSHLLGPSTNCMVFSFAARENRELDILFFKEVFDNVARVDRVLTKPGGSLLMAGRSGVGRRTAASLVSHMHNIQVFTPKVSRGYGLKQFKTDLKTVSNRESQSGQSKEM